MIDLDEIESAARKPWYCRSKLEDNLLSPEVLVELITRLRQAEKDAARYRWLMENCGKILEPARNRTHLYLPNYCPLSMDYVDVSKHIDEAMQCNK